MLDGDRIVSVGRRSAPPGCRVVDVGGKFVIPGLWDAHVHPMPWDRIFPPLFLANGVTGVRDMWGFPYVHEFRRRVDRGELAGPRILLSSNIIDGPHSLQAEAGATQVRTEAELRERIAWLPVDPANSRGWYNAVRKLEEGAARQHDQGKAGVVRAFPPQPHVAGADAARTPGVVLAGRGVP